MRRFEIGLHNGPAPAARLCDKIKGQWVEMNPMNWRLIGKEAGVRFHTKRGSKGDVIPAHDRGSGSRWKDVPADASEIRHPT